MKPIRNILAKLICLMFFINGLNLFAHDLQTPRGSQVEHEHHSDTGWGGHTVEWWTNWCDAVYGHLAEERLERANKAYNCHAYAWAGSRQSQQSTWCWIGNEQYPPYQDENIYWTDGSYDEVSSNIATRANYGDYKDHSLELTGNMIEGQYEVRSKWGKLPLYRHKLYSDPYDAGSSDTKFYRIHPAPPTNLYISGYQGGMPRINWTASTSPCVDHYELWWNEVVGPPYGWQLLATTSGTWWVDSRVTIDLYDSEDEYGYKARAVCSHDQESDFSNADYVLVDECPPWLCKELAGELEAIPEAYALEDNYPNPFNPATTIEYDLPEASRVSLVIYDVMGREVMRWEGVDEAGYRQVLWHGTDQQGRTIPAGIYIYRLVAASVESDKRFTASRKMVLLK